jgi:AcrR family transcriptional regulator
MTPRSQLNAERTGATRALLLQRARTVFEQRGYGAASVADIVSAAGVARGTFYVHFKSKREIFIALVGMVEEELVAGQMRPLTGSRTVADAVRHGIEQYLRAYRTSARMISLIEDTATSDRAVRTAWLATRDALLTNTVHALDRLKELGLARFDGSTRTVALALGAMVERMGALRYVLGYRFTDDELLTTLTTAYLDAARIEGDHRLTPRDAVDGNRPPAAPRGRRR